MRVCQTMMKCRTIQTTLKLGGSSSCTVRKDEIKNLCLKKIVLLLQFSFCKWMKCLSWRKLGHANLKALWIVNLSQVPILSNSKIIWCNSSKDQDKVAFLIIISYNNPKTPLQSKTKIEKVTHLLRTNNQKKLQVWSPSITTKMVFWIKSVSATISLQR